MSKNALFGSYITHYGQNLNLLPYLSVNKTCFIAQMLKFCKKVKIN